jgi:hypothetical protein
MPATEVDASDYRQFFLFRLYSVSGIVTVCACLADHLWSSNCFAKSLAPEMNLRGLEYTQRAEAGDCRMTGSSVSLKGNEDGRVRGVLAR